MRALVLIHRWLGVGFCCLFAMWFASGIVMHFVPFPALTEVERIAGLADIDPASLNNQTLAAIIARNAGKATRVRLLARSDGLVYIVQRADGVSAVHAGDSSSAEVRSADLALAIAVDHARRRALVTDAATVVERAQHDQWTVPNGLDAHRPLFLIALNDEAATELYVSSTTGEVVRDTTRYERVWNYVGSVVHWIYPAVLRSNWRAWDATVWALSLAALITALTGAVLGIIRIQPARGRHASPYRGWQAWHHWLGIGCMIFVLTWIFSGWLSMDHGRLFSTGKLAMDESAPFENTAPWAKASAIDVKQLPARAREIEWFIFNQRVYRRDRFGVRTQQLSLIGDESAPPHSFLQPAEVDAAVTTLGPDCRPAMIVPAVDAYPIASAVAEAPVYRIICAETWFHIDGATGAPLEKLDRSRRAYRWLYQGLHTLDLPLFATHAYWRTAIIILLCGLGVVFSLTAVIIGWRRLQR